MTRVLVSGAGAHLGQSIARQLVAQGLAVMAAYRTERPGLADALHALGATPVRLDLRDRAALVGCLAECDGAVFTPILLESVAAAPLLSPGQPAVFFSSNNVAVDRTDPHYSRVLGVERKVRQAAPQAVILRPTMIYGGSGDRTMTRVMRALRRWPVMLRPGARAWQQPVYFGDVAAIAARALSEPEFAGRTIAVTGPDKVTYRQLYAAAARAAGVRRPIVPVPLAAAGLAAALLQRLGWAPPMSPAQLRRARLDKHARGDDIIVAETRLDDGLRAVAATLWPDPV